MWEVGLIVHDEIQSKNMRLLIPINSFYIFFKGGMNIHCSATCQLRCDFQGVRV